MRSIIRLIKFLLWSGLLLALAGAAGLYYYAHYKLPVAQPITLELRSGSSLKTAAAQLAAVGVLQQPELFVLMARVLGESAKIKAGNYEFTRPLTPLALLQRITRGDVTQVAITFVEGWTFKQMRKALQENPRIRIETATMTETELLEKLESPQPLGEGWFFPDTYHFSAGTSDLAILRRANQLMMRHLNREWERRAPDLPLKSSMQALILASIVEKETGKPEERGLVAAVFINRLRIGMLLQTDPTVIYGLGAAFDGNLRKRDLLTDTPYNTYTRSGLPPTPIALPGMASLRAAVRPQPTKALYFVARGDGSSVFSETLAEHNRAVNKYQRALP